MRRLLELSPFDSGKLQVHVDMPWVLNATCRHVEYFLSPHSLMQTYSSKDPKLILAVPATLSHGPSRALFAQFAEIPDNVVLLTGRGEPGTLGRRLFDKWNNSQREEAKWDRGRIGSNIMMDGVLRLEVSPLSPGAVELDVSRGASLSDHRSRLFDIRCTQKCRCRARSWRSSWRRSVPCARRRRHNKPR